MLIRYLSDLHLEFIHPSKLCNVLSKLPLRASLNKNKIDKEVCILVGDIGNPYQPNYDSFMKYISRRFEKTFVIPGNHEYYNETETIDSTNSLLESYFKQFDNISFLNNRVERYGRYCFVGTTLWSKITDPKHKINDMYRIPKFDCTKYNQLNEKCIDFLKQSLAQNENCVVITHHVPSFSLIDPIYKVPRMLPYSQWFCNDMDKFIDENKDKIKCWFYGHTHKSSNTLIHGIPFLCNPIGYPNENKEPDFNAHIVLE